MKVAVIGECMVEIQEVSDVLRQGFAGDTLNTALYLARLCRQGERQAQISYFTALGEDPLSKQMLQAWQAEGIDTRPVRQLEGRMPGLYWVKNRPCGEREFFYWRGQSAARDWMSAWQDTFLERNLAKYDLIYLSGISLAVLSEEDRRRLLAILTRLRQRGCKLAFDSNYRPALWQSREQAIEWMEKIYPLLDVALLTQEDEQALFGDKDLHASLARLGRYEIETLVLKTGAEGCWVASQGQTLQVPTQPVSQVVDTTAAGDSFNAAFLLRYLQGHGCGDAARAGHSLAGRVIQHKGGIIPRTAMPALT